MVLARKVRVRLFEGERREVEFDVNAFLRNTVQEDLVSVKYNYQAPEVTLNRSQDVRTIAKATHGVCIVLAESERDATLSKVKEEAP